VQCTGLDSIKIFKEKGFDVFQMIAWNYLSASFYVFIGLKLILRISQFKYSLVANFSLAILPSIFLCLAKSLQFAGILKTEIAQRLSVVLSLLRPIYFSEQFSQLN
jgi:hypothetical protein